MTISVIVSLLLFNKDMDAMNGSGLLGIGLVMFATAFIVYGRYLKRVFGVDPKRECPSHTMRDDIDYCPTPMAVLFGHHFASIAGAGPIVGPVLAVYLGWGPAILWIVLGCIFIGSMHDFAAMFLSVRNKGRSVAYTIQNELGYAGRQIFLLFCLAALLLVVAVFTSQVAMTFLMTPSVATASILFILLAPFFGITIGRKILTLTEGSLVFVPLLFVCVWLGTLIPLDLQALLGCEKGTAEVVWMVVLLYYALCASIIPVWVLLQPRDYLNSFLLYAMMLIGIVGIFVASPALGTPMFAETPEGSSGPFPMLFVTIACGACSGFHALVASGTSSKQIDKESHLFPVGYGAMLVEGILAIISVISVCYLAPGDFSSLLGQLSSGKVSAAGAFAKGLAHFSVSLGIPYNFGLTFISLAISAFMLTSLDTATRLCRFVWQELVLPPERDDAGKDAVKPVSKTREILANRWFGTVLVVILAGWLALSGNGNVIWPVFGASNQLLAALTLLAVTLWLMRSKRPVLFAMLPMLFMLIISVWALIKLMIGKSKALMEGIHAGEAAKAFHAQGTLLLVSVILLVLAIWLVILGAKKMMATRKSN